MNLQAPGRNNPANPLLKVAALTLGAVDIEPAKPAKLGKSRIRKIQIVASLNFKRSDDMRGNAKAADGRPITVSFSMGISRASFELSATFEGREKKLARITNVAFLSPFEVESSVSEETVVRHGSEKGYELSGTGGLQVSEMAAGIAGHGRAVGKMKSGSATKNVRKTQRAFRQSNVLVTHGGNLIHWELSPARALSGSDMQFLEGEVFHTRGERQQIPACMVSWIAEDQTGPLLIVGSVYTLMSDLVVKNIIFVDEYGEKIEWKEIDKPLAKSKFQWSMPLSPHIREKERLLKQIIRKHLLSQGMYQDGARVEICRAHL
jgi:hypothetical protein